MRLQLENCRLFIVLPLPLLKSFDKFFIELLATGDFKQVLEHSQAVCLSQLGRNQCFQALQFSFEFQRGSLLQIIDVWQVNLRLEVLLIRIQVIHCVYRGR